MPDQVEKLLDLEADKQARIDEATESGEADARAMMDDLMRYTANRDVELFEYFGADPGLTLLHFEATEMNDRGPGWSAMFSAMWAAASFQVWLEIYAMDMLAIAEEEGHEIDKVLKTMSKEQIQHAAKKGISKERFRRARERRSNK
jgi:N-methylhydantoinase A/oxoprolinase/acetone carboxylase beta subunit